MTSPEPRRRLHVSRLTGAAVSLLLLACLTPTAPAGAQADNVPIAFGHYRRIHSKILGEDRTLLVGLPGDYATSGKRYAVLYKLDGDSHNFLHALSASTYLLDWKPDTSRDTIVVGIENTDRGRDMRLGPGGDRFIQFIATEVVPFVDAHYKTSGFRSIAGQSASSSVALHALLQQPALFDACLLASFGLSDEGRRHLENALNGREKLGKARRKYIFVANANRDPYDANGARTKRGEQFLAFLQARASGAVLLQQRTYDDEGHVPYPAIYHGLRWLYSHESPAR